MFGIKKLELENLCAVCKEAKTIYIIDVNLGEQQMILCEDCLSILEYLIKETKRPGFVAIRVM